MTPPNGSLPVVSSSQLGRTMPHSLEAEEFLLSCCLLDGPVVIGRCIEAKLTPASFYDPKHGIIYGKLRELYDRGEPCTIDVLAEELKTGGELDAVGGYAFLAQVSSRVPTTAESRYFIDKVREGAMLRDIIRTATGAVEDCYGFSGGLDEFVDGVEQKMFAVTQNRVAERTKPAAPVVKEAMAAISNMIARKGEMTGLRSGFLDLDKMTWGFQPSDVIIVAARPSMGKAQPYDASVLTPNGFVRMGDLCVGHYVVGRNGRPVRVQGVFEQGEKKIVRVTMSDGTSTRCCEDHLWFTQTRTERRRGSAGSVKTAAAIRQTLRRADGKGRNHTLPMVDPVEFVSRDALPLAPWLLGALLGDGKLTSGNVMFHKPEADLHEKIVSQLPEQDAATSDGCELRIRRRVRNNTASETRQRLDAMGLCVCSEHKFIPEKYLLSAAADRLELLRGLLDTDGYCNETSIEYSTSSEALAAGVSFLVRSLGGVCTVKKRTPRYKYLGLTRVGLPSYRINIWFHDSSVVPVSSRKHLRTFRPKARHVHRSIVAVDDDGVEPCRCISVASEDGLYVTDDFIVTHNTALALNFTESFVLPAKTPPAPVMFFSLEMSAQQLMQRMICSRARVNLRLLRNGLLSKNGDEMARMAQAADELSRSPLFIDDSSSIPVSHIRARARRQHARQPLGAVVVDYLQLMQPSRHDVPREQQVSDASRGLKALAKELNIPVIVLSQLNRASEKENRQPKLSDLRESGAIEQDADVILMLHRPKDADDKYQVAADSVELVIAKQRNGPVGEVKLSFLRDITRFESFHV